MQPNTLDDTDPMLDHRKLFGFRNLTEVAMPQENLEQAADQLFHKRGGEGNAA